MSVERTGAHVCDVADDVAPLLSERGPHRQHAFNVFMGQNWGGLAWEILNVPAMIPAASLTFPALISGPQGFPILTDYLINERVRK